MRDFAPDETFHGPIWAHKSEREVIAAALYSPGRMDDAFERLTATSFYDPVHSRLWAIVAGLHTAGGLIDPGTVAHRMGADEAFAEWGGADQLSALHETADLSAARAHIEIIADLATRRLVERAGRKAADRARDTADATGVDILADMEREAAQIGQTTSFDAAWSSAGDMLARAIEAARNRDASIRFPIGLVDVDAKLGGLNAGETTTVAAWTGMGKTIAALQIAKANGRAGKGVAYFSLEMAEAPMAMRMACDMAYDRSAASYFGATTNLTINRALWGQLTPAEIGKLMEAHQAIDRLPIFFDTRPNLSVAQIKAATVRLHRMWAKHGIEPGPVIVDHIGKVRPSQDRRGNVTAETRDVANDLDALAKDLNVPVVALSQLNRQDQAKGVKDKRPTLSSIKDSGALAENSRQVIFIYRPEYDHREPFEHEEFEAKAERLAELEKVKNHFYWIIEKNSNGPRAQVLSYCKADCSAVRDWNLS